MKRRVLLLLLSAALGWTVPAAADVFLLGFTGFDYSVPNRTVLSDYLQIGDQYYQVGTVTSFGPMLSGYVDPSVNWYTHHMFGLTVTGRATGGTFIQATFNNLGGRTRYYEDPFSGGTAPVYGINPPNATAPSTFTDGTVAIGGHTYNFVIFYDYGLGQGDFQGNMDIDEGSYQGYIPTASLPGWILGGLSGSHSLFGPPNTSVPAGYDHQVSGECYRQDPTSTTHRSWGAIKALYR